VALLTNPERRLALAALETAETPLSLRDLATEVVSRERGVPPDEAPAEAVTSASVSLYHVHLPKLVEAGVISFDADRRVVEAVALDGLGSTLSLVGDGGV
jgi:hypothetical protein